MDRNNDSLLNIKKLIKWCELGSSFMGYS